MKWSFNPKGLKPTEWEPLPYVNWGKKKREKLRMCVIPSLTQDLTSQKKRHIINNSSLNLRFLLCVSEIQRVASGAFALVLSYPQPSHPSGNLESNWFAAIELSVLHYLKEMDYLTLQGYFSNHTKKKVYLTPISLYPGLHTLCDSISMMASPSSLHCSEEVKSSGLPAGQWRSSVCLSSCVAAG